MGIYKYLRRETFVPNSAHARKKTIASEKEKMFLKKALALVTEIRVVVNFYPHTYHKLKQKFIFL